MQYYLNPVTVLGMEFVPFDYTCIIGEMTAARLGNFMGHEISPMVGKV